MPSPLDRRNQGARQPVGRGRPSLGITKKVSLTLTESEWAEIEASSLTVAAFLKERMKKAPVAEVEPVAPEATDPKEPVNYPRRYVEERWEIHLRNAEESPAADIIEAAKASMFGILFPKNAENAVVRTHQQYECPFTGKRYGSMDKLVRTAIPYLIERKTAEKAHKSELAAIEKAPKYL
ncbi:hypothetical protein, partial [Paenibacillus chibensis]|uniref:hypothetical protein n=1 Tax=Paenibacillus chibensis TaxID=59846 RepID=UPI002DBFEF60